MSLYERTRTSSAIRSDAAIFVRDTYMYFALSLVAATLGAYLGATYLASFLVGNIWASIGTLIVEIALIMILNRKSEVTNGAIAMLFAFAFISGLSLTGIIYITLQSQAGATIIAQALFLTTLAFAGLSVFAFTTKRDFSVFAKGFFIVLLIMIGASLLNLFFQSHLLHLIVSCVGAIVFSFFIIYDTQMIIRGAYQTPIQGAIALYLDFINLFISLLNILRSIRD
ncbi:MULTISPECIES: Bax inhibitor-1/YccA family protein [unclassified Campylobacter]|uniref:Bax inhibitor-1/YccA family protein n=1 Tax=unclassified Campylobacter TaxID=2593542 RepID=UPI001DAF497A|nr:Bax inhibitor-1/YccA family protein [Campylobacter sp. RM12651]MBZ7975546.1 Bax inhibitor-1/YccA family protein [Campylobacter sp. RM12637]MBZ7979375.1 Bax inhibitor-1/YccA family protein [Campylobacter sp. RM12642]MBZ7990741.1 Bax inhibitor-1/YccA family protein [Campylobacter sp. RM9331]MBZ7992475.1 Bax inhibitor-1/YccA family protein [Campylobacter sp. RM9333]MBZ8005571.1 Bax inhibitor-1/YccA family protein [Campylobacter sp. RM9332]